MSDDIQITMNNTAAFLTMMVLSKDVICPSVVSELQEKLGAGREIPEFGKYIRHIRLQNDSTLLEMSRFLNIPPSRLCGIEIGEIEMPQYLEFAIAGFFDKRLFEYDKKRFYDLAYQHRKEFKQRNQK